MDSSTFQTPSALTRGWPSAGWTGGVGALLTLVLVGACAPGDRDGAGTEAAAPSAAQALEAMAPADRMERLVSALAADSMEGRRTGSPGAARAARFIARELESYGIEPAYGDSYMQPVPLTRVRMANGRERMILGGPDDAPEGAEVLGSADDVNVVGLIRGSHPERQDEAVILGAHFDHVGMGAPVDGDSIFNGADDDASGTAAVLEVARVLSLETPPERTVVILLTTGEEMGLLGTRHYINEPVISMEQTVADLQVEMIGRPDEVTGGPGRAWLTGFERTTLGDALVAGGIPLVPDERLEQNFFFRSDNIAFAYLGIPAHTLSSYNMHSDYHQLSDEVELMDFQHMAEVTAATAEAVRILANGPRPEWKEGGMPEPRGGDR